MVAAFFTAGSPMQDPQRRWWLGNSLWITLEIEERIWKTTLSFSGGTRQRLHLVGCIRGGGGGWAQQQCGRRGCGDCRNHGLNRSRRCCAGTKSAIAALEYIKRNIAKRHSNYFFPILLPGRASSEVSCLVPHLILPERYEAARENPEEGNGQEQDRLVLHLGSCGTGRKEPADTAGGGRSSVLNAHVERERSNGLKL